MDKHNIHFFNFVWGLDLLWEMTIKEVKLRYKNTTLGFLWVIIYPVIQVIIIGYVFSFINKTADSNYKYSLFLNLLIWNFFSSSLENATSSIVQNRTIVKKAKFPYIVIPLSIVLCNGIHLLLPLMLFCVFVSVFHITSGINVLMIFISCLILLFFTGSLSLITSALNVKWRDVGFLIRASLMVWFYATPIIYNIFNIPANINYLWSLNPLTEIVMFFQYSFFRTPIFFSFILLNSLIIIGTMISGLFIFRRFEDYFDDYI